MVEDEASIWTKVQASLSNAYRGGDEQLAHSQPSQRSACAVGIVGWIEGSREETAQLPRLREAHDGPLVAVLRRTPSPLGARTLAAHIEGVVLLEDVEDTLLPTLKAVAAGMCVIPQTLKRALERPPLSPRERQILAMVVLDFSNAEIAAKLFLSESNVKNHLSSAFQKLGVSSRSAAAALILDRDAGLGPGILRISSEETLAGGGDIN